MTAMIRTMTRVMLCSMSVLALALGPSMANEPYPNAHEVKCDESDTLQEELDNAEPGFVILVKGTCYENVVIRTPGILLVADPSFGCLEEGTSSLLFAFTKDGDIAACIAGPEQLGLGRPDR